MLRRYDKLKRAVALVGVLLALLPGVAHSHVVCQLGICSSASATPLLETNQEEAATCSHTCCQTCAATSASTAHQDSCPCPPDCWCQKAPQPLEMPRGSSESSETLQVSLLTSPCDSLISINAFAEVGFRCHQSSAMGKSAPEQCAALCRFLI